MQHQGTIISSIHWLGNNLFEFWFTSREVYNYQIVHSLPYILCNNSFIIGFEQWKENEEVNMSLWYVKHKGSRMNKNKTISTIYYCHHSEVFKSKNTRKHTLKLVGSCKIGKILKYIIYSFVSFYVYSIFIVYTILFYVLLNI